MTLTANI